MVEMCFRIGLALLAVFASLVVVSARPVPGLDNTVEFLSEPEAAIQVFKPLALSLNATIPVGANPFNCSAAFCLQAKVVPPAGGVAAVVDAFFFQNFSRALVNGMEELTPLGEPFFRLLYTPTVPGVYTYTIVSNPGNNVSHALNFTATPATNDSRSHGFVRVSPNNQTFSFDDTGDLFFMVGENVCWPDKPGTFNYDVWFPRAASSGANYARIWLADSDAFDFLTANTTLGKINLAAAWRVDYVLGLASSLDMRLMFCLNSFNELRRIAPYPDWDDNPLAAVNGGPMAEPKEYFYDPAVWEYTEWYFKYVVARYGYSPHVLSWELWNEVDGVEQYDPANVSVWHTKAASFLRSVDPNAHMVTTSMAEPDDVLPCYLGDTLDYTQTHDYVADDWPAAEADVNVNKSDAYRKPTLFAEFGLSSGTLSVIQDPTGISILMGAWGALVSQAAGTAMTWWWDSYVDPQDLYYRWAPVAAFVANSTVDLGLNTRVWRAFSSHSGTGYDVFGQVGDRSAGVVLVRSQNFTWNAMYEKAPLEVIAGGVAPILLQAGAYSVDWFNATTGAFVSAASFESSGAPFHLPVPTFQYGVVGKVLPAAGGAAPPDAAPERLPLAGGLPGGRHRGRKT